MKQWILIAFLICLVVANTWTLLHQGMYGPPIHDYVHGARIAQMNLALADLHLPPRWSRDFGYGYGMPLFEFYGPLPFFVGAVANFFFSLEMSVKLIFFLPALLTIMGSYKLGEKLGGMKAGMVVATVISLAPYRAVNTFIRGAVSELWGMTFTVWLLVAMVSIFQREKYGWLWFSLALAGVIMSHNLTVVMMMPVAGILAVIMFVQRWLEQGWSWKQSGTVLIQLISASMLGFGLASFYLIPAFLEKSYTQVESRIIGGYFDYTQHFLYIRQFFQPNWQYGGSNWGPHDDVSFFLGYPFFLIVTLAVIIGVISFWRLYVQTQSRNSTDQLNSAWIVRQIKAPTPAMLVLLWGTLGMVGLCLFLTLTKSDWIWSTVSLLKYLQFPWRWLTMSAIATGLLAAVVMSRLTDRGQRWLLMLVIGLSCLHLSFFQPKAYLQNSDDLYYSDPVRIQAQMSDILPDYIPKNFSAYPPVAGSRTRFLDQYDHQVLVDRTHQLVVEITVNQPEMITIPIADYPGWMVKVDGKTQPQHVSETGLIQAKLTEGKHVIEVRFGETALRQTANTITLLSVVLLTVLLVWYQRRKWYVNPSI